VQAFGRFAVTAAAFSCGLLALCGCELVLGLGNDTDLVADASAGADGTAAGEDSASTADRDAGRDAPAGMGADAPATTGPDVPGGAEGGGPISGDAAGEDSSPGVMTADSGAEAGVVCGSSVCAQVGTVCQDNQTLVTCAVDANHCLSVASTSKCNSPQSCSGMAPNGACSLTCSSSCTQGQTSCVSGGLATCTLGSNGCWAYGAPIACPGTRQACGGTAGAAVCKCNVDALCKAAGSVCTNTTTVANCAADAQGCFYASSSPACAAGTPFCNGAGVCGVCQNGTTRCSFNGVETCGAGAWGAAIACPASTPTCGGAGVCGAPPSCKTAGAGRTNCGASSESCCTSEEVGGGTYFRTYTNSGAGPTGEADPATVSGFRLDKYDVTVGRYRQFVSAWTGGYTPPAGSGKHAHLNGGQGLANASSVGTYEPGWLVSDNSHLSPSTDVTDEVCLQGFSGMGTTWTSAAGSNETLPINCVNWYEAYAFCIWDGGFLPSVAELGYAMAGGNQQRVYPWGSTPPGTANQYAIFDCNYPNQANSSSACTGEANVAPVGFATLGAGVWGQLDLTGNLIEWNVDAATGSSPFVDPCTDCALLTPDVTDNHAARGYSNSSSSVGANDTPGAWSGPEPSQGLGLRCARVP
jgi:sulfatase modifying factor 1